MKIITSKNPLNPKISFLILLYFLIIYLLICTNSFAWAGYDYENKTDIDIGQGNLVREGNVIQFYETLDDNFHTAKVQSMQSVAGGVELIVIDLDSKKERTFIMY